MTETFYATQQVIPLIALHLLGAIKHVVFDRRGTGLRMIKPISGGR